MISIEYLYSLFKAEIFLQIFPPILDPSLLGLMIKGYFNFLFFMIFKTFENL